MSSFGFGAKTGWEKIMVDHSFCCLSNDSGVRNLIPHTNLPSEYIGRSMSIIDMRQRILPAHVPDLTEVHLPDIEPLFDSLQEVYGSIMITKSDPLNMLNSFIALNLPWYVGFHGILGILHSDFLIVECLARAKKALGVSDLRGARSFPAIEKITAIDGAKDCVDYSIESAFFDLVHAIYRLRSAFDKLAITIGYAFHIGDQVRGQTKYKDKISLILNSGSLEALRLKGNTDQVLRLIASIHDINDLKELRDKEAHLQNLEIKHGFRGKDGKYDLADVIDTIFNFLDKYRIALLSLIVCLPSFNEGGRFPMKGELQLSKKGFYIFDAETKRIYMSFVVGKNNILESPPTGFGKRKTGGLFDVCCENGSVVTLNFPDDTSFKIMENGKNMKYKRGILHRNSACGYERIASS